MKASVPVASLKRLGTLERPPLRAQQHVGYLRIPPILPMDQWERLAVAHQRELMTDQADDRQERERDEKRELGVTYIGANGQSRWAPDYK